jgi:hypothetical protein
MQTKKRRILLNFGKLAGIVRRQGNERNYVANLTVESTADSMEYALEGCTVRDRLKNPFLRA